MEGQCRIQEGSGILQKCTSSITDSFQPWEVIQVKLFLEFLYVMIMFCIYFLSSFEFHIELLKHYRPYFAIVSIAFEMWVPLYKEKEHQFKTW